MNTKRFYLIGFLRNLYLFLPIATLYYLQHGISMEVILFSATLSSLFQFVGEIPTGIFADKYGQKASIIVGYFIESFGILMILLWPTSLGLYLCYAFTGLAQAFLSGSEEALLYESAKQERKKYTKVYGTFLAMQMWGMVTGGIVAGLIIYFLGNAAYIWLIFTTVLSLLMSAGLSCLHRAYRARIKNPAEGTGMLLMLRRSVELIRNNDTILYLMIGSTLTLGGGYYLLAAYPPIFVESGVPNGILGIAFSVGAVFSALCVQRINYFERHMSLDKLIFFVAMILAFGYLILSLSFNPFVVVIAFLLLMSLIGIASPIISDYINEHIPSDVRSTTLSGISLISRIAIFIQGAVLSAAVAYGGIRFSLIVQAGYLFIGACISYALFRRCRCIYRIKTSANRSR